jgi:hypothetical protein
MQNYPGDYLSTLPNELIRELDKIQAYVDKNEIFNRLGKEIENSLNSLIMSHRQRNFIPDDISILNGYFERYNVDAKFEIVDFNPAIVRFVKPKMQHIPDGIIEIMKRYVSSL